MMHRVRTRWPKIAASFLGLALVALAAAGIAGAPAEQTGAHHATAELTALHHGKDTTLTGSVKHAPYIRSAARTQTGLRSKTSDDSSGKAYVEDAAPRPVFALRYIVERTAKTQFPSSFIALRALGPRAPPPSLA